LDEKGGKMSKSTGNAIDGADLLEKYPVDLVRFYFIWKASPIEPISFSTDELMSRPYQVINTLFNLHLYFKQNSEYDNFDSSKTVAWAKENQLLSSPDIWLLSKLQKLIKKITEKMKPADITRRQRQLMTISSTIYARFTFQLQEGSCGKRRNQKRTEDLQFMLS
jgi:isoleucyl-tRNA synthetase